MQGLKEDRTKNFGVAPPLTFAFFATFLLSVWFFRNIGRADERVFGRSLVSGSSFSVTGYGQSGPVFPRFGIGVALRVKRILLLL
jgi:hypothetical protein